MRFTTILRKRLRSVFSRNLVEQELDEELRYHIERETEENVAAGMTPEAARREALLTLEGLDQNKEECRDMRRLNLLDNLAKDLRFEIRQLRKEPGIHLHRDYDAGAGTVRQRGDLRIRGRGLAQAAALPRSAAAGRCVREHHTVQAQQPVVRRLPRLEKAEPLIPLAGRIPARGLHPGDPRRCAAKAGRARKRRILSHPRHHAGAGARFPCGRRSAGRAAHRHAELRRMAAAIRREGRRAGTGDHAG